MCSLLPEDLHSELNLSLLQLVLCRVAAVKRLPIHQYSADYIFWSFRITGLIPSHFENRDPLKPLLGTWAVLHHYIITHEQINKTKSAIFITLCNCLQRILIQNLYYTFREAANNLCVKEIVCLLKTTTYIDERLPGPNISNSVLAIHV